MNLEEFIDQMSIFISLYDGSYTFQYNIKENEKYYLNYDIKNENTHCILKNTYIVRFSKTFFLNGTKITNKLYGDCDDIDIWKSTMKKLGEGIYLKVFETDELFKLKSLENSEDFITFCGSYESPRIFLFRVKNFEKLYELLINMMIAYNSVN